MKESMRAAVKDWRGTLKIWGLMTFGTVLVALGVYCFKFPNHFSTGGVSGLGVVLGGLFPGFTPGNIITVINILFLVLGFAVLKGGFGVKTVYCSLLFSLLLDVLERVWPLEAPLTDQPLLELFFAVLLPALGSGILFNIGASTGGTDIAALILKNIPPWTRVWPCCAVTCSSPRGPFWCLTRPRASFPFWAWCSSLPSSIR